MTPKVIVAIVVACAALGAVTGIACRLLYRMFAGYIRDSMELSKED